MKVNDYILKTFPVWLISVNDMLICNGYLLLFFLFNQHRYKAKIYIKENYNMEECADTTGK